MVIAEDENLIIRSLDEQDAKVFAEMSLDGSLKEIGFDKESYLWMDNWIKETTILNDKNNPLEEYLAYTAEEKKTGKVIGSVGCSYYDDLDAVGICYFVGAEYRNKGYAAEIVDMISGLKGKEKRYESIGNRQFRFDRDCGIGGRFTDHCRIHRKLYRDGLKESAGAERIGHGMPERT